MLALFLVLLFLPSVSFAWFSGLPLRAPASLAALAVLAPYAFSRNLRSAYRATVVQTSRRLPGLIAAGLTAAVVVKLVLMFASSGAGFGFAACYRSLDVPEPVGCERSFDNPLDRLGVTRVDPAINFAPRQLPNDFWNAYGIVGGIQSTNWNLGFLNTNRFDFLQGGLVDPLSRALPRFSGRWTGRIDVPAGGTPLVVTYIGEGSVASGGTIHALVPSYDAPATVTFALQPGRLAITVSYRFDPSGPLSGTQAPPQMQLLSGTGAPLAPAPPAAGWRLLALFSDTAAVLMAASLLLVLLLQLGRARVAAAIFALGSAGAALAVGSNSRLAVGALYLVLIEALLVLLLLLGRRFTALEFGLAAYLCLLGLETARALTTYGTLTMVQYRASGEDFLTYESLARSILQTHSLRGGESVFVYSPAFRYLLFAEHVLLGDGNVTVGVVGIVALTLCVFLLARKLFARVSLGSRSALKASAVLVGLIAMTTLLLIEAVAVEMVRAGFSEYPPWILILLSMYCLLSSHSLRMTALGLALAALAFTFRFDEGLGVVGLCGSLLFVWSRQPVNRTQAVRVAVSLGGLAIGIMLLPSLHNLYYGHQIQFLVQTPILPVNFPIPYHQIPHVVSDPALRHVFINQLKGVTDFWPTMQPAEVFRPFPAVEISLHALEAEWGVAVVWAALRWSRVSTLAKLLLALPAAFLIPHLFVQVYVYYPRHIVAGYLAMSVGAAWTFVELLASSQSFPGLASRHVAGGKRVVAKSRARR